MNPITRLRFAANQQLPQAHQATVHKLDLEFILNAHADLVEALEQALQETVDAPVYPDGPCIEKATRDMMRAALAKAKGTA